MRTILGIEALGEPMLLARRQEYRAILASSYDRRGGNHDWSNYVRREGRQAVMMEAQGPGCITRIWTADPQKGTVRIFIDGRCALEMPFAELFSVLPLTSGLGGESQENYTRAREEHLPMGFTSYCPIPFESQCKVTIEPEDDYLYYQIGVKLFPPGTELDGFGLESAETQAAGAVLKRFEESLRDARSLPPLTQPSGGSAGAQGSPAMREGEPERGPTAYSGLGSTAETTLSIEPGSEAVLLDRVEPGVITGLWIALPKGIEEAHRKHLRENLWLVGHFDDDEARDASIRAPLGAFFLDYGQTPRPQSLMIGAGPEESYYCHFAMPFTLGCRIKLVNNGILPAVISASTTVEELPSDGSYWMRFRATWHTETPFGPDHRDYEGLACRLLNLSGQENLELLYVHGAGHFVGCGFSYELAASPTDRAAGESDEMFFIDDDSRLTQYGTGLEDYTNDAWGMSGFAGPFAGDAKGPEGVTDAHLFGYRMHLADPVPFVRKGRFTFEHGTGNNCSGEFKSVAYWYMDPSHSRTRIEERRWEAIRTGG